METIEEEVKIILPENPITDEDEELIKSFRKNEKFLLENKKWIKDDPSMMLYRLPLTDEQREALYNKLMDKK